ncbi:MG284/MPN403 family protein [Mycoplasma sp. AC157]|uniref:MG284/MPN403 family protein n=1 Tax=Mycoplasma sp. 480 TaxID=3440155 RepID=UPI003F511652
MAKLHRIITFVEKRKFMELIILMHNKLKLEQSLEINLDPNNQNKIVAEKPVSIFEKIMDLIEPEYSYILRKEFLENNKNWFKKHWSKSTYYKNINKAIDRFLFYLYGQYPASIWV